MVFSQRPRTSIRKRPTVKARRLAYAYPKSKGTQTDIEPLYSLKNPAMVADDTSNGFKRAIYGPHPAADALLRFTYCETIALSVGTGGTASVYTFRANDLYDPNFTGTGHQPLGFDQWMAFYNHFSIRKARIHVKALNPSATTSITGDWGIGLFDDSSTAATILGAGTTTTPGDLWREQGFRTKQIGNHGNSAEAVTEMTMWFDFEKFFNTKYVRSLANFIGSAAGSPSEVAYFSIFLGSLYNTVINQMAFEVTIDYFAGLSERKFLGPS